MKNMLKSNKKGFTLVELLAVIVILALLIVITATTILPMLGKARKTGMTTYAERMLSNAQTNLEADKLTSTITYPKIYKISADLADGKTDYAGCVMIDASGEYSIKMYDLKNNHYLVGEGLTTNEITDASKLDTSTDYVGDGNDATVPVVADIEAQCGTTAAEFDALDNATE